MLLLSWMHELSSHHHSSKHAVNFTGNFSSIAERGGESLRSNAGVTTSQHLRCRTCCCFDTGRLPVTGFVTGTVHTAAIRRTIRAKVISHPVKGLRDYKTWSRSFLIDVFDWGLDWALFSSCQSRFMATDFWFGRHTRTRLFDIFHFLTAQCFGLWSPCQTCWVTALQTIILTNLPSANNSWTIYRLPWPDQK